MSNEKTTQEVAAAGSEGTSPPAKPKGANGRKLHTAKESVKSKAKRRLGSPKTKKAKKSKPRKLRGSSKIQWWSIDRFKVVDRIRDAVPVSDEDRQKLWEGLDREGFKPIPLIATSDDVLVDGHGRLTWLKRNRPNDLVPVIVREDLNYAIDPNAVEVAAIGYAVERRNLTREQILTSQMRKQELDKLLAPAKQSAAGTKSAKLRKLRKEGKAAPPESGASRNRGKKANEVFGTETVRKSRKVVKALKTGELPIAELRSNGIVSVDLAHQVLKAKVEPEKKIEFLEKQREIVKTVLGLPESDRKREATRLIWKLLGKKAKGSKITKLKTPSTPHEDTYKPLEFEPEDFPRQGPSEVANVKVEPTLTDEPQDVNTVIARCRESVIELTKAVEVQDFRFTDKQKSIIEELVEDLDAAARVLTAKLK